MGRGEIMLRDAPRAMRREIARLALGKLDEHEGESPHAATKKALAEAKKEVELMGSPAARAADAARASARAAERCLS